MEAEHMESLQDQIELKSKEIHTDSYPISLGEVISMYKDGDIDIHPEFQRFFRWTTYQKTMLIESILLNIPIPAIFVAQRKDGVWDVVDGVQRMSTILQFFGVLKNDKDELVNPLILEETKLLPLLKDKKYGVEGEEDTPDSFTEIQRRYLKRAKLNFIIIQKESDNSSKFELFQRLNTGGTTLTPQEVRSCLMVMTKPEIFRSFKELTNYEPFISCLKLSDKNIEEQYDLELVIRFICLSCIPVEEASRIIDLSEYLNSKIVSMMNAPDFSWEEVFNKFKTTFDLLDNSTKEHSFERYDLGLQKFSGGFLVSAYEMIALGIGYKPESIQGKENRIEDIIKNIWQAIAEENISWKGYSASGRLAKTLKLGRRFFHDEED